jgi:hypothetical protein
MRWTIRFYTTVRARWCGFSPVVAERLFSDWAILHSTSLRTLVPSAASSCRYARSLPSIPPTVPRFRYCSNEPQRCVRAEWVFLVSRGLYFPSCCRNTFWRLVWDTGASRTLFFPLVHLAAWNQIHYALKFHLTTVITLCMAVIEIILNSDGDKNLHFRELNCFSRINRCKQELGQI